MYIKIGVLLFVFVLTVSTADIIQADEKTPEELVQNAKDYVRSVSIHEIKKIVDAKEEIILLDVRDKDEFEKEHLPDAINISRGQLEFLVEDKIPDKGSRVVVY